MLQLLSQIPDHRKGQGKLHKLENILFLSVIAQLMGATNYKEIWVWITKYIQVERIKKLLGVEFIKRGINNIICYFKFKKRFKIFL